MASTDSIPFVVGAKGGCFMCLQQVSIDDGSDSSSSSSSCPIIISLKLLTRFLKVEFERVFDISSPLLASPLLKDGELGVPLCEQCVAIFGQFTLWYRQLELVRLKLEGCVRKIAEVMASADRDSNVVSQYSDRTIRNSVGPQDLVVAMFSDKLRKEVAQKASSLPKRSPPRVELNELDEEKIIPTGYCLPVPLLPSLPTGLGLSKNENSDENYDDDRDKDEEEEVEENTVQELDASTGQPLIIIQEESVVVSDDEDQIKFRPLANGSYSCGLCSAVVKKRNISNHKSTHSEAETIIKSSFPCKSSFFSSHQDPRLSSDQFDKVVQLLFYNLSAEISPSGRTNYKCFFCQEKFNSAGSYAQTHLIRKHTNELVPRLLELQQTVAADPSSIPKLFPMPRKWSRVRPKVSEWRNCKPQPQRRKSNKLIRRRSGGAPGGGSNSNRVPCAHCHRVFDSGKHLSQHLYRTHVFEFFLQYKKPCVDATLFNDTVLQMFRGLNASINGEEKVFKCGLCSNKGAASVVRQFRVQENLHKHAVQVHMEELRRRLDALLNNNAEKASGIEGESFGGIINQSIPKNPFPAGTETVEVEVDVKVEEADGDIGIIKGEPMEVVTEENVAPQYHHHQMSSSRSMDSTVDISFACNKCGETFSSRSHSEMAEHAQLHRPPNPGEQFVCPHCFRTRFSDQHQLRKHGFSAHKAQLFSKFKKDSSSSVSDKEFGGLVMQIVKGHLSIKSSDGVTTTTCCDLCQNCFRSQSDAEAHVSHNHLKQIGNELVLHGTQQKKAGAKKDDDDDVSGGAGGGQPEVEEIPGMMGMMGTVANTSKESQQQSSSNEDCGPDSLLAELNMILGI